MLKDDRDQYEGRRGASNEPRPKPRPRTYPPRPRNRGACQSSLASRSSCYKQQYRQTVLYYKLYYNTNDLVY